MRRSTIWFALAVLWLAVAPVAFAHHRTGSAVIDATVAVIFFFVGLRMRGREISHR